MAEKKYYWLKLKENFFEEDTIAWLEEQQNGVYYSNFYLKLCLKSLKTDGILIRNVGEILIPYDISKLAEMAHVNKDTAIVAMELFKKIGLVQILENGEIYLTQLNNMVGSETSKAALMRKKREKDKLEQKEGNNVTKSLPKCYTEKEKELEKDIDIEKELEKENKSSSCCSNTKVFKHFEKCGILNSVTSEPKEYSRLMEFIAADIKVYGSRWLMNAADEAVKRGKYKYSYVQGILQNWKADGREKNGTTSKSNENTGTEEGPKYDFSCYD